MDTSHARSASQNYVNPPIKPERDYSEIKTYYSVAGPDYEAWSKNLNMHFGYCRSWVDIFSLEKMLVNMSDEVLKKLLIVKNNSIIADLGCGVGSVARYAAEKFPHATIHAITIVPDQVKKGKELTGKKNIAKQVQFRLDNFEELSIPDHTFSHAYAIESACHARGNSKKLFIKEMARTLKPGGRFCIADGFLKHSRKKPSLFTGIYKTITRFWAVPGFADINLFTNELEENGLYHIEVREISWQIAPSVCHVPWTCIKFLARELWKNKSLKMRRERWHNVYAPLLGMVLGLYRKHFGYYIISGIKK